MKGRDWAMLLVIVLLIFVLFGREQPQQKGGFLRGLIRTAFNVAPLIPFILDDPPPVDSLADNCDMQAQPDHFANLEPIRLSGPEGVTIDHGYGW